MSTQVYVVYDGDPDGPIDRLAHAIQEGAASVDETHVVLHRAAEATVEQMVAADAIILGSPNWHGMTADLKKVIDQTGLIWEQGKLVGKVGAAFTSGWSRSGGQEMTLLMLLHMLLAHGMVIVGLPWSKRMVKSGSYYGPPPSEGQMTTTWGRLARLAGGWRTTRAGCRTAATGSLTTSRAASSIASDADTSSFVSWPR